MTGVPNRGTLRAFQPVPLMALSDARIRSARPKERAYKLWDEKGLFLLVKPNGSRLWRWRVQQHGRETLLSFGAYPAVSLAQARTSRDQARARLAAGEDARGPAAEIPTFEAAARLWLDQVAKKRKWKPVTTEVARRRLEQYVFNTPVGRKRVHKIAAREFVPIVAAIDSADRGETALRVRSLITRVMRFAAGRGWTDVDPSGTLRETVVAPQPTNRASVKDPAQVGRLMLALRGYLGTPVVQAALQLAPYVFLRPGELRQGRWPEIDLEAAEWRIPGERMKMGRPHLVPLSRQAVAILKALRPLTDRGTSRWVFPCYKYGADRPMSENTLNGALRRLGYAGTEMTAHGFRSMASTLLNEMKEAKGWDADAIERQLAHVESNKVRGAYDHSTHLEARREMMQVWADYLDSLAAAAEAEASTPRAAA